MFDRVCLGVADPVWVRVSLCWRCVSVFVVPRGCAQFWDVCVFVC